MAYQDQDGYGGYDDEDARRRRTSPRDLLMDELDTEPVNQTQSVQPGQPGNGPAPAPTSYGDDNRGREVSTTSRDDALRRVQEAYSQAGVTMGANDEAELRAKNPEDVEGYVQALIAQGQRRATNTPGGGSQDTSAPAQAAQVYSGGDSGGSSGAASGGLGDLLGYLKERDAARQAEQASVRSILMEQLGAASKPVDVNDPTLKAQLDPQKLALQRSAERKRSQMAARLASDGLLDSGTFDTSMNAIEEQRGAGEAGVIGDLLGRESNAKRAQLQNLLQLAIQSGDAEAARNIQAQLQAMGMQIQDDQFGRSLAQQDRQFGSTLGYNYDALGQQGALGMAGLNQSALLALLGAI